MTLQEFKDFIRKNKISKKEMYGMISCIDKTEHYKMSKLNWYHVETKNQGDFPVVMIIAKDKKDAIKRLIPTFKKWIIIKKYKI